MKKGHIDFYLHYNAFKDIKYFVFKNEPLYYQKRFNCQFLILWFTTALSFSENPTFCNTIVENSLELPFLALINGFECNTGTGLDSTKYAEFFSASKGTKFTAGGCIMKKRTCHRTNYFLHCKIHFERLISYEKSHFHIHVATQKCFKLTQEYTLKVWVILCFFVEIMRIEQTAFINPWGLWYHFWSN